MDTSTGGTSDAAPITIYTTAWCRYCDRVKDIFDNKGFAYVEIDVDNPEKREWLTGKTGQQTVPQVYVGDRHVGGWDEISSLERSGGLVEVLSS